VKIQRFAATEKNLVAHDWQWNIFSHFKLGNQKHFVANCVVTGFFFNCHKLGDRKHFITNCVVIDFFWSL
jgi:hypothetical protein